MSKCKDCGQMMVEIALLAGEIQLLDNENKLYGIKSPILYQCPECKTVAVN